MKTKAAKSLTLILVLIILFYVVRLYRVPPVPSTDEIVSWVKQTLSAQCSSAELLPADTKLLDETTIETRGRTLGLRKRISTPEGHALVIERIVFEGQLRRLSVEFQASSRRGLRPVMHTSTGPDCVVRAGRRLYYRDPGGMLDALEYLDGNLNPVGRREPLNPEVPPGKDHGGVRVGLVDSGVNYLLPLIHSRLARDKHGKLLGYDYWDEDPFPFDSQAVPSVFYPRHHGTRSASIILREAPTASLVPYRYPRPEMTRMKTLVDDAADQGVKVMNLSMGSYKYADWAAFESVAREHPEILFVVSAGNNGHDIDVHPVYPAALDPNNMITVTSADDHGGLAQGSNWGKKSVDLLVPGEDQIAVDYDGQRGLVSGTTYAAARVSALAARLLAIHPEWTATELKNEIFRHARADQSLLTRLAVGRLDPFKPDTQHATKQIKQTDHFVYLSDAIYPQQELAKQKYRLQPDFVILANTGWDAAMLRPAVQKMATILSQCEIAIPRINVYRFDAPRRYLDFHLSRSNELARAIDIAKPTVFFIRDSLQKMTFDASAFGKSNTQRGSALRDTVWVLRNTRDLGISLAHELVHVLLDSGAHTQVAGNLMHERTSPQNIQLTLEQCRAIINTGLGAGLLLQVNG